MTKLCFKNQIQSGLMLNSVRILIFIATFQLLLPDVAQALPERFRCMWRDDPSTSMVIGWDQVTGSNPMFYFGEEDHDRMINFYSRSKRPDMIINARRDIPIPLFSFCSSCVPFEKARVGYRPK